MNPINPYGSSVPRPSQGPAESGSSNGDSLRGVGGKFTRRGAVRAGKGVRGYKSYLESKVGHQGSAKARKAATKVEEISARIKAGGARASAAISQAAGKAGKILTQTAQQLKSKIQSKVQSKAGDGGKQDKITPEQEKMKALAQEAAAKVGRVSGGDKRSLDEGVSNSEKKARIDVKSGKKKPTAFRPDLGAIAGKDRVKLPRANVSSQNEGVRKSQRQENQKTRGILKQPGAPKTSKKRGRIRWADQEGKPLEQ
ncbi:hypothetical protein [Chlamydia buteonis]|uniref:Uncharacterized protein n=1 Tax=Chlamydia buteonis TaxID=2494525 RepID=A0ABX8L9X8_9CHLA|nr:hypothetical protein [Chlamydia buteonis]QXE27316.1 hypothetical protein HBN95_04215 [Chlamydia buteonis]QXE27779.1 hypothetical protein JJJ19_03985 [Chlamydia buteonis]